MVMVVATNSSAGADGGMVVVTTHGSVGVDGGMVVEGKRGAVDDMAVVDKHKAL